MQNAVKDNIDLVCQSNKGMIQFVTWIRSMFKKKIFENITPLEIRL